jgi:DNA-binding NtrC family response regulator
MPLNAVEPIIGVSPCAVALRRAVAELPETDGNAALAGEPGTGKRFLAWSIHEQAQGARRLPLVEISPRTSEGDLRVILFEEHRRTQEEMQGCTIPRLQAGGTLFIRGVHEFGFLAQGRIARFLMQQERLAGRGRGFIRTLFALPDRWELVNPPRPMNATLEAYCRQARSVMITPLRHRREDIPHFIRHFLCVLTSGRPPEVDARLLAELHDLPYYDNVRELRLLLADALAAGPAGTLRLPRLAHDEPALVHAVLNGILGGRKTDLDAAMHDLEKALIRRALLRCNLNRPLAAALLGLSDVNLRYRLRKYDLALPPGPAEPARPVRSRRSR